MEAKPESIIKMLWKIIYDLSEVIRDQKIRIERLESDVWVGEFRYSRLQEKAERWRAEYD